MTWPGAALYIVWFGLLIAYFETRNSIVLYVWIAAFIAILVWRMVPQRSRSCALPAQPITESQKRD